MPRNYGFLTDGDREKLTSEEIEIESESDWRRKVRKSVSASYEDMVLLEESPHWDDEDHKKALRPNYENTGVAPSLTDEDIDRGISAVLAEAKTYQSDLALSLADELDEMMESEELEEEIERRITEDMRQGVLKREVREIFAEFVVKEWRDVLTTADVLQPDKVIEDMVKIWPDRDTIRAKAEDLESE